MQIECQLSVCAMHAKNVDDFFLSARNVDDDDETVLQIECWRSACAWIADEEKTFAQPSMHYVL